MHRTIRTFTITLAAAISLAAFPGVSLADDFVTFQPWSRKPYCADGADFNAYGNQEQHIAVGGNQLFAGSCTEDGAGNDYIERYDGSTGSFVGMAGGAATYLSATTTGSMWVVTANYPGLPGHVFFWNGGWWAQKADLPGGRYPHHVAAAGDTMAFVTATPASSDSCPGGDCIWYGDGSSWQLLTTSWSGTQGAVAVAYDSNRNKLWILTNDGHVRSLENWYGYTYFADRGSPPGGALAFAVLNDVPWAIVPGANAYSGGPVYSEDTAGVWNRRGTVASATDIALDASSGAAWIVTFNGTEPPPPNSDSHNIMFWAKTPR
jgi:hypothetical protein